MILRFMEGPRSGKSVKITTDDYTLGRDDSCDMLLDKDGISRVHCRIKKNGSGFVIQDNDSTNGVFLNGKKLTAPHALKENDTIRVGDYLMLFTSDENLLDSSEMAKLDNVRKEKIVGTPPPAPVTAETDAPKAVEPDSKKDDAKPPKPGKATVDDIELDFSRKKKKKAQDDNVAKPNGLKSTLTGSTGIMLLIVIILTIILFYILLTPSVG